MEDKVTLRVEGMTCDGCEQRIGNALRRVDGERQADADRRRGVVDVAYDPAQTDQETLIGRIQQAGYRVAGEAQQP
jgi:copper chaperone